MINRLPLWFRQEIPQEATLRRIRKLLVFGVNTVCQSARCPNLSSCFKNSELTFMILGNICTRACAFCAVNKSKADSLTTDFDEPYRIREIVRELDLKFVVITSVARDDLIDGGASIFVKTVELIRELNRKIKIEVLMPDFKGNRESIKSLVAASPDVIGHNIEMIKRLYKDIRPQANYQLSLGVLRNIKEINSRIITKSSIMLGLGEREEEVISALQDLRENRCDLLTLGQYLAPSESHYPVKGFIAPEKFKKYKEIALGMGFKGVLSGPKVRSSYKADKLYKEVKACMI